MPEQSPTRFTMVPARRSNEPTARRRARRVLGTLFLAAGLSVVAVFISLAKGSTEPDLSGVAPRGRGLAYTAAMNFLAGTEQNVPHADNFDPEQATDQSDGPVGPLRYRSLNWTGFTPEHFGSRKAGFTDFEVHHFLVYLETPVTGPPGAPQAPRSGSQAPGTGAGRAGATPSPGTSASPSATPQSPQPATPTPDDVSPAPSPGGTAGPGATREPASDVLQLDVPILLSVKGPRLAAAPAFSVWRDGAGGASGKGDYTNYGSLTTQVSDAGKNQILIWARAYASGDTATLLSVTGDQNRSHRYVGLSGFTLPDSPQAVQILSALKAADQRLIVRVRVLLARSAPGGGVSGGKGAVRPFTTFADFDLLMGAPAGAQPPILAWGPAGSAAELEPYQNAIGS